MLASSKVSEAHGIPSAGLFYTARRLELETLARRVGGCHKGNAPAHASGSYRINRSTSFMAGRCEEARATRSRGIGPKRLRFEHTGAIGNRRIVPGVLLPDTKGGFRMDAKSFLIGALIVALLAGGYFYYDSTRSQVRVDAGGVKIQAD